MNISKGRCSLEDFEQKNVELFRNEIFISFKKKNSETFEKAIIEPTVENKKKLEDAFQKYYFNLRFTSYLSKSIHFTAVNFDKNERKLNEKNQLILDQHSYKESSSSQFYVDNLVENSRVILPEQAYEDSLNNLEHVISSSKLYSALSVLTENQKEIIKLAYIDGLRDVEISEKLGKSQQAVSKSHQKALQILKELYLNK